MSTVDYVALVQQFHLKMAVLTGSEDRNLVKRLRLMTEETAELTMAIDEQNIEQIADACCDLEYVIAGTLDVLSMRQDPGVSFANVIQSREARPLNAALPHSVRLHIMGSLIGALSSVYRGMAELNLIVLSRELNYFTRTVMTVAWNHGIPFDECFQEVHRSNMSKDPLNEHGKGGKGKNYTAPNLGIILFKTLP